MGEELGWRHGDADGGRPTHLKYTTVTGFFLQDDPTTDPSTFDYTKVNLGLINRTYPTDELFDPHGRRMQWERFAYYVDSLNRECGGGVAYKVLIIGRHGEGYHNVAEAHYGTEAWDCYWSLLDGDGTLVWDDAELTPIGRDQAQIAHDFWSTALTVAKIPAPESYYSSPLQRCIQTANVTFDGLDLPATRPFKPVVKELLRESIGVHTCDRRHPKSWISANYPSVSFESDFPDLDPLWKADERETFSARVVRMAELLDEVFEGDGNTWISFSSHSGAIGATLEALGHRGFGLTTGGVIPVLVRAEVMRGERRGRGEAPTRPPECTVNPGRMAKV
ncbi:phosphoglycerate mutase-like protein [Eremomyces bilateralis CBS 781.70]|uniref:Phosphoglycerate mutase-like protein n=1 Tax=Eremomyces bilateralis CBS 781.70 TaxID=1392243 RepID=A0A6G1G263_9PEZI|nr:phosphoglycerate mutase-like protein [Eremomyces bilateralis CBS 781.70]KAF1812133.1 phosphoglycerate mutase-like protein [Eremomyces bilateralis CBS 781.70]